MIISGAGGIPGRPDALPWSMGGFSGAPCRPTGLRLHFGMRSACREFGAIVTRGEEVLLLEAQAPEAKLPFVRDAFLSWARAVAAGSL